MPVSKSSLDITSENVEQVMAQYADEIAAAGFTEAQIAKIAEAVRAGGEIPDEVLEVMAAVGIASDGTIPTNAAVKTDAAETTKYSFGRPCLPFCCICYIFHKCFNSRIF